MKKIYLLKNSEYNKLHAEPTYILDTNIVIDLRNLFYKPCSLPQEKRDDLEELLYFLRDKHVIEGIAIAESTWDFQELRQDEGKALRIKHALDYLLNCDERHLNRVFNELQEADCPSQAIVYRGKRKFGDLSNNADRNLMILPTLAVLLKFYELLGEHSKEITEGLLNVEDRRKIYLELIKFVDFEMHFMPTYEIWFITQVLFNNDENRDKILELLKLKGKDAKGKDIKSRVWNASWDIFYMRILSESTRMYLSGQVLDSWKVYNPILVTGDKNLYEIGHESMTGGGAGIRNVNGQIEVALDLEFPTISDEDYEFIDDVRWGLEQTKEARVKFIQNLDSKMYEEYFKGIVRKEGERLGL